MLFVVVVDLFWFWLVILVMLKVCFKFMVCEYIYKYVNLVMLVGELMRGCFVLKVL